MKLTGNQQEGANPFFLLSSSFPLLFQFTKPPREPTDKAAVWCAESYPSIGLPGQCSGKGSACQAGEVGSVPGSGGSPGEGSGDPFQYSCLGNPMHRGAWRTEVHGVTRVRYDLSTEHLHTHQHHKAKYRRVGLQLRGNSNCSHKYKVLRASKVYASYSSSPNLTDSQSSAWCGFAELPYDLQSRDKAKCLQIQLNK